MLSVLVLCAKYKHLNPSQKIQEGFAIGITLNSILS